MASSFVQSRNPALFEPGTIGSLEIRNRFVRPGTSETMGGERGEVTPALIALYEALARNEVGLICTGHLYCHPRGQYAPRQTGIYDDSLVAGLARLTAAVRPHGARLFAQLSHAGSQSRVPELEPLAPSPVPNELTGRMVEEASDAEVEETVAAFGAAAARAVEAGFDGVHIHGANGYLISEFSSPLTNWRSDRWGGSAEGRDTFPLEVVRAVRSAVPVGFPVTMKIGFFDAPEGGLEADEVLARARRLVDAGLDAVEVSCNVMEAPTDSANAYVAVDRRRALGDLLFHRILSPPSAEAYFRPWARAVRAEVETKLILVGGMRTTQTMGDVLASGDADFIAMARPFIREPDIVRQIADGRIGRVDCTSCNLCLMHEGHHSLRCWRTPRHRLLQHAAYRLSGGLRRGILRTRR
jgi:2,4-dienoyl-CoA reductase-like NADH-dependent reductase (Old Yellow Enzyme family)